jgi:aryl-alcohol dehydrogenase-like predicted oxidoreductase
MEYVNLGSTGTKVSPICFGTWRFGQETDGVVETDREQAHEILDTLDELYFNFIDTANGYGGGDSERWIGEWLDDRDREDYVVASKVYWSQVSRFSENLSRKNIRAEIEGSLDRLDTDYLDLYYIHRFDDDTPVTETLRTLDRLIQEGKVHYVGASSMAAWKLTKALWHSDLENLERFEVTQPRYNAVYREPVADYLDVCADQDIAVCPYSPLEGGFLTGKYDRDGGTPEGSRGDLYDWEDRFDERQWNTLEAIQHVAEEEDATAAQVSLRWMMDHERFTCIPIVGARSPGQLEENLGAADVSLSDDQRERITEAY